MNAGIVVLQDGTPCIVYDEALSSPVRHVEFSREDHQITLVYDDIPKVSLKRPRRGDSTPAALKQSKIAQALKPAAQKYKLEYPLDPRFTALLEKRKTVAIGLVQNGQLANIRMIPVVFTNA
jgi:hypothetical protein